MFVEPDAPWFRANPVEEKLQFLHVRHQLLVLLLDEAERQATAYSALPCVSPPISSLHTSSGIKMDHFLPFVRVHFVVVRVEANAAIDGVLDEGTRLCSIQIRLPFFCTFYTESP